MSIPILRTKIIPPHPLDGFLTRPRLIELLDESLDRKLVIVSAPAGYGKTTLLSDLAARNELPFCWYSLDLQDADLQRFLHYLLASIQLRFPEFGEQTRPALHAWISGSLSLDHLQITLVNELFQTIREHFVIVLDDYHTVDSCQPVNALVSWLIRETDQNCHFVILSRRSLPLQDLPSLVARSQVGGIGQSDLAFRVDETRELMRQNYRQIIPENIAMELVEKTEGWITGLLLSAQTLWKGMTDRLRAEQVTGVGLYEYLADQVLEQQPAEIQDFLLKTSFMSEFNAELCERILGPPASGLTWQDFLDSILGQNLFIIPSGGDDQWFHYHPLFQEFLQNRFWRIQPEAARQNLRSLIEVYLERGDYESAYLACQRLGEDDSTADFLEQAAGPLLTSGRVTLLSGWLDALPFTTLSRRPILMARQGLVLATQGETLPALRLLDQAISHFRDSDDLLHLSHALVWRALVWYIRGDHPGAIKDIEETLSLVKSREGDRPTSWVAPEAYRLRGQCFYLMGNLDEAISNLRHSLAIYESQSNLRNINLVLVNLGAVYLDAGDFHSALGCYQQALEFYRDQNSPFSISSVLNDMAFLYHLRGEYLQAFTTFEEALSQSRRGANLRVEALVLLGMGDLYLDLDSPQAALELYTQARPTVEQLHDQYLMIYLDLAESAAHRLIGDFEGASVLANSAAQVVRKNTNDHFEGLILLEDGRLALARQDFQRALEALTSAVRRLDARGRRIESCRALLLLAEAAHQNEKPGAARDQLERLFQQNQDQANWHFLIPSARLAEASLQAAVADLVVGRKSLRLLEQMHRFEAEIPKLQRLLRRESTVVAPSLPRLEIQALGKTQVAASSRILTGSDWQTQITRDLFFLILSNPDGWTKESIGEILWPESSPSQLRLRFKNTIYRLRRALGQESIVFDGERYAFNRGLDYEYDVERFWETLGRIKPDSSPETKIKAYRSALEIYQGDYLPDLGGAWVLPERERLHQAYLNAGSNLAQLLYEVRQYDQSLEICQRLMTEEPCLEKIFIIAMQAFAATGNRSAVIQVYRRLENNLLAELGIPPSPPTENFFHTLIG